MSRDPLTFLTRADELEVSHRCEADPLSELLHHLNICPPTQLETFPIEKYKFQSTAGLIIAAN